MTKSYSYRDYQDVERRVTHEGLVKWNGETQGGDSGGAMYKIMSNLRAKAVGLHIAGSQSWWPNKDAWFLPIWTVEQHSTGPYLTRVS